MGKSAGRAAGSLRRGCAPFVWASRCSTHGRGCLTTSGARRGRRGWTPSSDYALPEWVGESIYYQTPKVVRIHDKRLSLVWYLLQAFILFYIVGYQIMVNNKHLRLVDVTGV